ncbi:HU family DNA-binding protein [Tabrizicola oligotrophica]|uniref:HU family DNA-binding protein n=1 Tax=Tabrizicola oligotrophica TaxID=2710650 RepID=A0A6M0QNM0_9RHOB|nr:HU family DNA-binding protein [Tabrizicola oligotrophica]NEY88999.1 HU family DNA-binding protein [Tabrizicola oligotrophica]
MPSAPPKKPAAKAATAAGKPAANSGAKPARTGAKPAGAAKAAAGPVEVSKPTAGGTLRPKDLIARVAEATGGKIKDIRGTVAATLEELGKSLDAGETLVLPPLGKLRVAPGKAEGGDGPMRLKLHRGAGVAGKKKAEKEPLAEPGEAS